MTKPLHPLTEKLCDKGLGVWGKEQADKIIRQFLTERACMLKLQCDPSHYVSLNISVESFGKLCKLIDLDFGLSPCSEEEKKVPTCVKCGAIVQKEGCPVCGGKHYCEAKPTEKEDLTHNPGNDIDYDKPVEEKKEKTEEGKCWYATCPDCGRKWYEHDSHKCQSKYPIPQPPKPTVEIPKPLIFKDPNLEEYIDFMDKVTVKSLAGLMCYTEDIREKVNEIIIYLNQLKQKEE